MAIEYPTGLPLPLREGYGLNHVDPVQRTDMASGRSRMRQRFTSVPSRVSVSWLLTTPEAQLFEGWHAHTLKSGVEWFDWPTLTPMGLKKYEARFMQMYDGPQLVGLDSWRITAQVELFERPLMPADWIEIAPDFILGSSIFDKAMNREWPKPN